MTTKTSTSTGVNSIETNQEGAGDAITWQTKTIISPLPECL